MTQEEIAVAIANHENEIKSLKHRMEEAELTAKEITKLSQAVAELAIEMRYLREGQQDLADSINSIREEPLADQKFYKRTAVACIITTVVGGMFGAICSFIIQGGLG